MINNRFWGYPILRQTHMLDLPPKISFYAFGVTLLDQCMVQSGTIAWHVTNDNTVVCLVSASGKKISTVADTMCDITRTRGVTEIRVTDHALQPKMQVGRVLKASVVPSLKNGITNNNDLKWNHVEPYYV